VALPAKKTQWLINLDAVMVPLGLAELQQLPQGPLELIEV